MDKDKFIQKAYEDVSILISNYLSNGQFSSYCGWENLDEFIYDKFPFLSIAYLIRSNFSIDEFNRFIINYNCQITNEVNNLKGILLTDVDAEMLAIKQHNEVLTEQCATLQKTIEDLEVQLKNKEDNLSKLKSEVKRLNEKIEQLQKASKVIYTLSKEHIIRIWSKFYSLPYVNDNAIVNEDNFDIEGFTSALLSDFSIYISPDEILSNNSLSKLVELIQGKQASSSEDFKKKMSRYPQSKEKIDKITADNVTQIILSCCHKTVFATDSLERAELDVDKLNSILSDNFGLKVVSPALIRSAKTIGELKTKIVAWQSYKLSSLIAGITGIAALAVPAIVQGFIKNRNGLNGQ